MDLRVATLKAISFYLLYNVSRMYQCRKSSCVTVVCKHIASYQDYPIYRLDLFGSLRVKEPHVTRKKAAIFNILLTVRNKVSYT
jgi:hypothetical protein